MSDDLAASKALMDQTHAEIRDVLIEDGMSRAEASKEAWQWIVHLIEVVMERKGEDIA